MADKSPVLHRDAVDTSMATEPMVGQIPLVDGTSSKDASGAPCVATKCLQKKGDVGLVVCEPVYVTGGHSCDEYGCFDVKLE